MHTNPCTIILQCKFIRHSKIQIYCCPNKFSTCQNKFVSVATTDRLGSVTSMSSAAATKATPAAAFAAAIFSTTSRSCCLLRLSFRTRFSALQGSNSKLGPRLIPPRHHLCPWRRIGSSATTSTKAEDGGEQGMWWATGREWKK